MFEFIGSYDNRTTTGTIAASEAHQMVKASQVQISTPRKPKARTIAEIKQRAAKIGAKIEIEGKWLLISHPISKEYYSTDKRGAWQTLDEIQLEIVKAKPNKAIAAEAQDAISFFN